MVGSCEIESIGTTAQRNQYNGDAGVTLKPTQSQLAFWAWDSTVETNVVSLDIFQGLSNEIEGRCPEGEDDAVKETRVSYRNEPRATRAGLLTSCLPLVD